MMHNLRAHSEGSGHERARFFVLPSRVGDWLIFREGIQRAIHRLPRKILAVQTAKTMAHDNAPSEVIVERWDGSFHKEIAYASSGAEIH